MNTALCTIPRTSVTEVAERIYPTATVILEALGSRMQVEETSPWTIRLEAKIRENVSQVTELEKSVMRDRYWMKKRYRLMYITEALETNFNFNLPDIY